MEITLFHRTSRMLVMTVLLLWSLAAYGTEPIKTDVCVYGGTSGGVIAAVQAARMGKSVALVVVDSHLGGMTSGGLGQTDIGRFGDSYIQGLAREFYVRVGHKYQTGAKFTFEPHVAESVFNELVREAHVQVYTNKELAAVSMAGQSISAAQMSDGTVFQAKVFIDASYEGDLMARAHVSFTVGRESTNAFHEDYNGVRPPNTGGHQFGNLHVDPYRVPGNPASGLLPLIQNKTAVAGAGDQLVQSYNFRMCLTRTATNKIDITAPANYSTNQYELLARYIQAMEVAGRKISLATFMNIGLMPDGKTDINNNGPVSTDFIGESTPYIEADSTTRRQIWLAHKNYLQGFLYFLATDLRVPENVRASMSSYGLCKDEFTDTAGWPFQLYVREARRMISDYVMTQSNCLGLVVAPDSVGLAAYAMDSHNCQRIAVNGRVENEGDTYNLTNLPEVYPVSYRSLVPKSRECTNLLVPWCLSATHIAFGSIRMEPVFMILAQSAATAACMAIDNGVAVQNVNISELQERLLKDGQLLQTPPMNGAAHGTHPHASSRSRQSHTMDANSNEAHRQRFRGSKVVAFGDSITHGYGVPKTNNWVGQLQLKFGLDIVNVGINGNTSSQGLGRLQRDVLDQHPDFVIINFGMNDMVMTESNHPKVDQTTFRNNLENMVDRVRTNNSIPILVTANNIIEGDKNHYFYHRHTAAYYSSVGGAQAWLDEYLQIVREVADSRHVDLIDVRKAFNSGDRYLLLRSLANGAKNDDGVHPYLFGSDLYARTIGDYLDAHYQ